jgi:hypothetical protein
VIIAIVIFIVFSIILYRIVWLRGKVENLKALKK